MRVRAIASVLLVVTALSPVASRSAIADEPSGARVQFTTFKTGFWTKVWDAAGNLVESSGQAAILPGPGGGQLSEGRCNKEGALSFMFNPTRNWGTPPTYRFNPNVDGVFRAAINRALAQWVGTTNNCGSNDVINFAANQGADENRAATDTLGDCPGADGWNIIDRGPIAAIDGNEPLGVACLYPAGDPARIAEADIRLVNAPVFADGAQTGLFDIQSVAAHEWGHFLGLGHSKPNCDGPNDEQIMYPCIGSNDTSNRVLGSGDIEGASRIYGPHVLYDATIVGITNGNTFDGQKLTPGREYSASLDVRNDGALPWRVGGRVFVGTEVPRDRASVFQGSGWFGPNRPSNVDQNLSVPGKTYVARGETGRFGFALRIPYGTNNTVRTESFGVLAEGIQWTGALASFTADVGTIGGLFLEQGALPPLLVRGVKYSTYVLVRNFGSAPWAINDVIKLGTSNPRNRVSQFCSSDWSSGCTRASYVDGNEDHPGRAFVAPNERARLTFDFEVPITAPLLTQFTEQFELVNDASWDPTGTQFWFCCGFSWTFTAVQS